MSNSDDDFTAYVELSRAMKNAWSAALHLTGCIDCARREIEQNLAGEAYATEQWVIGQQPCHLPRIQPQRRGGISRTCRECLSAAEA